MQRHAERRTNRLKCWLAQSTLAEEQGPGARRRRRSREAAALSAGEMEFYLDESSHHSARMGKNGGSGVTTGRINDTKQ